ncbi:hypothetical protein Pmani_015535 [Petrolisthes manimaculis]|uniref:Uncharacterized protein n=1 Tax=Petrolisthes manimaculis TaxID=1843537 RepID=A0AAE1PQT2_9EUCA|nr:hypothetical protein Pmani_015535 [Petrolisthes manimaculis]
MQSSNTHTSSTTKPPKGVTHPSLVLHPLSSHPTGHNMSSPKKRRLSSVSQPSPSSQLASPHFHSFSHPLSPYQSPSHPASPLLSSHHLLSPGLSLSHLASSPLIQTPSFLSHHFAPSSSSHPPVYRKAERHPTYKRHPQSLFPHPSPTPPASSHLLTLHSSTPPHPDTPTHLSSLPQSLPLHPTHPSTPHSLHRHPQPPHPTLPIRFPKPHESSPHPPPSLPSVARLPKPRASPSHPPLPSAAHISKPRPTLYASMPSAAHLPKPLLTHPSPLSSAARLPKPLLTHPCTPSGTTYLHPPLPSSTKLKQMPSKSHGSFSMSTAEHNFPPPVLSPAHHTTPPPLPQQPNQHHNIFPTSHHKQHHYHHKAPHTSQPSHQPSQQKHHNIIFPSSHYNHNTPHTSQSSHQPPPPQQQQKQEQKQPQQQGKIETTLSVSPCDKSTIKTTTTTTTTSPTTATTTTTTITTTTTTTTTSVSTSSSHPAPVVAVVVDNEFGEDTTQQEAILPIKNSLDVPVPGLSSTSVEAKVHENTVMNKTETMGTADYEDTRDAAADVNNASIDSVEVRDVNSANGSRTSAEVDVLAGDTLLNKCVGAGTTTNTTPTNESLIVTMTETQDTSTINAPSVTQQVSSTTTLLTPYSSVQDSCCANIKTSQEQGVIITQARVDEASACLPTSSANEQHPMNNEEDEIERQIVVGNKMDMCQKHINTWVLTGHMQEPRDRWKRGREVQLRWRESEEWAERDVRWRGENKWPQEEEWKEEELQWREEKRPPEEEEMQQNEGETLEWREENDNFPHQECCEDERSQNKREHCWEAGKTQEWNWLTEKTTKENVTSVTPTTETAAIPESLGKLQEIKEELIVGKRPRVRNYMKGEEIFVWKEEIIDVNNLERLEDNDVNIISQLPPRFVPRPPPPPPPLPPFLLPQTLEKGDDNDSGYYDLPLTPELQQQPTNNNHHYNYDQPSTSSGYNNNHNLYHNQHTTREPLQLQPTTFNGFSYNQPYTAFNDYHYNIPNTTLDIPQPQPSTSHHQQNNNNYYNPQVYYLYNYDQQHSLNNYHYSPTTIADYNPHYNHHHHRIADYHYQHPPPPPPPPDYQPKEGVRWIEGEGEGKTIEDGGELEQRVNECPSPPYLQHTTTIDYNNTLPRRTAAPDDDTPHYQNMLKLHQAAAKITRLLLQV